MTTYWFDLAVAGPVTDDHVEALGNVLTVQAVISAIRDVEAAGIRVSGAAEDRLTAGGIAEQARVADETVRNWISGSSGPGGFPAPVSRSGQAATYSRAEVAAWLARQGSLTPIRPRPRPRARARLSTRR